MFPCTNCSTMSNLPLVLLLDSVGFPLYILWYLTNLFLIYLILLTLKYFVIIEVENQQVDMSGGISDNIVTKGL